VGSLQENPCPEPFDKNYFASGYVEPELKDEILNGGTHVLLQKPYSPFILLHKIRSVLDVKTLSSKIHSTNNVAIEAHEAE